MSELHPYPSVRPFPSSSVTSLIWVKRGEEAAASTWISVAIGGHSANGGGHTWGELQVTCPGRMLLPLRGGCPVGGEGWEEIEWAQVGDQSSSGAPEEVLSSRACSQEMF